MKPVFFPAAIALALSAGAGTVLADDDRLATTTVTASRSVETVDASLATVSVLTREDIERSQALDLLDLLRVQAGIDLARSGGPGGTTSLFLRGSNSNHVLVLVDGVRVSSLNTGALDWSNLPVSQVERIEIVRGPRAAYWGSDAIGGVVQIFTRQLDGGLLSMQAGSHGTRRGQVGFGADIGSARYSVVAGHERTDGFSSQNEDGFGYWPDDDGHRQRSLSVNAGVDIGRQVLSARLFRAEGDVEFDNGEAEAVFGPAVSETITQSVSLGLAGALTDRWSHQLTVSNGRDDLDTPINASRFWTRRNALDWQNAFALAAGQILLFGINWLDEEGFAADGFGDPYGGERDTTAGYLGWRGSFGALDTELVGRYDDNSDFGGEFTGSAALGFRISDAVRLTASLGEGFRAPNLNELYSPGFDGWYAGNPDLDPERSRSAELGADLGLGNAGELRLRAFRTRVRDMISFTGGDTAQAENIARARIDGVEAEYAVDLAGWRIGAGATWQDPRNEADDSLLLRRAKRKGSVSVDRGFGERWQAGIDVLAVGSRADAGFPSNITLAGYGLVTLRAAWSVTPDWTLEARVDNAADKNYTLVHGYNTAGRGAYLGFRWQPRR